MSTGGDMNLPEGVALECISLSIIVWKTNPTLPEFPLSTGGEREKSPVGAPPESPSCMSGL